MSYGTGLSDEDLDGMHVIMDFDNDDDGAIDLHPDDGWDEVDWEDDVRYE